MAARDWICPCGRRNAAHNERCDQCAGHVSAGFWATGAVPQEERPAAPSSPLAGETAALFRALPPWVTVALACVTLAVFGFLYSLLPRSEPEPQLTTSPIVTASATHGVAGPVSTRAASPARALPAVAATGGLGVSRSALLSQISGFEFTLEADSPVDGQPRALYRTADHLAILELMGPEGNLRSATAMAAMPSDAKAVAMKNGLLLFPFLKGAFPGWSERGRNDWLAQAVHRVANGPTGTEVVVRLRGRRAKLSLLQGLGFVLTVSSEG